MVSNRVEPVGLGNSRGCGRKPDFSLVVLQLKPNQQQLPMRTEADVPIPAADDAEWLPASQLKSPFQTPPETARCSRHNYQPFNLRALFRSNSESLILFEKAPAATFQAPAITFQYQQTPAALSCTSRFQQQPVLHQRPPSCTSRHQRILSCTSRH